MRNILAGMLLLHAYVIIIMLMLLFCTSRWFFVYNALYTLFCRNIVHLFTCVGKDLVILHQNRVQIFE